MIVEAELPRFPAGVHDDDVDSLGLVEQLLDRVRPGIAPKLKPETAQISGYKSMRSGDGGSWRV